MNEKRWSNSLVGKIQKAIDQLESNKSKLVVKDGQRLPYAYEIVRYPDQEPKAVKKTVYETDLLIYEQLTDRAWKPRLIIEVKINGISTHDAITYSQKASAHKTVHPYLRYGILLGNLKQKSLPGRLFRHGAYFDFMLSWKTLNPSMDEFKNLVDLIRSEIKTSRHLEEIIFDSRKQNRKRYTFFHRPLKLKEEKTVYSRKKRSSKPIES